MYLADVRKSTSRLSNRAIHCSLNEKEAALIRSSEASVSSRAMLLGVSRSCTERTTAHVLSWTAKSQRSLMIWGECVAKDNLYRLDLLDFVADRGRNRSCHATCNDSSGSSIRIKGVVFYLQIVVHKSKTSSCCSPDDSFGKWEWTAILRHKCLYPLRG